MGINMIDDEQIHVHDILRKGFVKTFSKQTLFDARVGSNGKVPPELVLILWMIKISDGVQIIQHVTQYFPEQATLSCSHDLVLPYGLLRPADPRQGVLVRWRNVLAGIRSIGKINL